MAQRFTPTARAFVTTPEALPELLRGYSDELLEAIEAMAQRIAGGAEIRITNHTPRGHVLSETAGQRVLKAVHDEQTRRCDF